LLQQCTRGEPAFLFWACTRDEEGGGRETGRAAPGLSRWKCLSRARVAWARLSWASPSRSCAKDGIRTSGNDVRTGGWRVPNVHLFTSRAPTRVAGEAYMDCECLSGECGFGRGCKGRGCSDGDVGLLPSANCTDAARCIPPGATALRALRVAAPVMERRKQASGKRIDSSFGVNETTHRVGDEWRGEGVCSASRASTAAVGQVQQQRRVEVLSSSSLIAHALRPRPRASRPP